MKKDWRKLNCLSVCPSVHLSNCLSIYQLVWPPVCQSVFCLLVLLFLSVYLSICPSIHLSVQSHFQSSIPQCVGDFVGRAWPSILTLLPWPHYSPDLNQVILSIWITPDTRGSCRMQILVYIQNNIAIGVKMSLGCKPDVFKWLVFRSDFRRNLSNWSCMWPLYTSLFLYSSACKRTGSEPMSSILYPEMWWMWVRFETWNHLMSCLVKHRTWRNLNNNNNATEIKRAAPWTIRLYSATKCWIGKVATNWEFIWR